MKTHNMKRGTPDGSRGGHRRYRLTGATTLKGVVVETKAREILHAKREPRWSDD